MEVRRGMSEVKPMSDYISREQLINEWSALCRHYAMPDCNLHKRAFKEFPSADVRENIHGEWIVREDNTSFVKQIPRRWVECSHCGWSFSYDRIHDDFCSKCGADMKTETCKGCTHSCVMYEPRMKACEKKGR